MSVKFPQADLPRGLSGGRDAWDNGPAGALLAADYFDQVTIKAWNGSAWVTGTLKRWNGSAWVAAALKRWNGSAWVTV